MQIQACPHCGVRVIPSPEGTCPSCKRSFHDIPENTDPRTLHSRIDSEAAELCPILAEALRTSYTGPKMVRLSDESGVTIDFGCGESDYRAKFSKATVEVYCIDHPAGKLTKDTPEITLPIPEPLQALRACGAPRVMSTRPVVRKPWWKIW